MNKLTLIFAALLLFSITANAQNNEKANKIQAQIDAVQKQIEANPCYIKSGSKFCKQKDDDKYQKLLQQKKNLETAKQTKLNPPQPPPRQPKSLDAGTTSDYMVVMTILGVVAVGVVVLAIWAILGERRLPESIAHGSARFATENELIQADIARRKIDLTEGEFFIGGLGKKLDAVLPKERTSRHIQIIGSTGSGKTYSTIAPNILFSRSESLFISDVKDSELWTMTSGYKKHPIRIDPMNPRLNMMQFNWIPSLHDDLTKAKLLSSAVIYSTISAENAGESIYWYETARDLIAAIWLHIATTEYPTPRNAYQLLMSKQSVLQDVLENSDVLDARTLARNYLDSPEKAAGSMLSTARNACSFMQQREIQNFTATTQNTDFSVMREIECAAYYQAPYQHEKLLKPLNCLLLTYLFQQLKEKDGLTVKFILDEFANFGRIPNFESEITLLRSKKMPVIACVQTLKSQIQSNYGRSATETILGNFNTKIAFAGLEINSTKEISQALGKFTYVQEKTSKTDAGILQGSTTTSINEHARDLMTPDEITRMNKDNLLVFHCGELHPFIAGRIIYNTRKRTFEVQEQPLVSLEAVAHTPTAPERTQLPPPFPEFPEIVDDEPPMLPEFSEVIDDDKNE